MEFELDYDAMIMLDAEDLAEGGIGEAYEGFLPAYQKYVPEPLKIEEELDNDKMRYAVKCAGKEYVIYAPDLEDEGLESWVLATYALFSIVNDQLADSAYRFFAINGGNELGGFFLTQEQALAARKTLPNKRDWPYLPTTEKSWGGQHH
jgi:hypothetical protein